MLLKIYLDSISITKSVSFKEEKLEFHFSFKWACELGFCFASAIVMNIPWVRGGAQPVTTHVSRAAVKVILVKVNS